MVESKETVPSGHIASIVTHLEMRARPPVRDLPSSALQLEQWEGVSRETYSDLFRRVGAPWLWFSRLVMPADRLEALLMDAALALHAVKDARGAVCGMLELDFQVPGACEIAYLGLTPEHNRQGHGGWLMAQALMLAWGHNGAERPIERVWLRTCTLDHPAALGFYRKHGFIAIKQEVEIYPDPRLTGHLPRSSAPQIPIIA